MSLIVGGLMGVNKLFKGAIPVIFIIIIVFLLMAFQSFDDLYGDARTINFSSLLRGGVQHIVNQELSNKHMDSYIGLLNGIIDELKGEAGIFRIKTIKSPDFQDALLEFENQWDNLVNEIYSFRETGDIGNIYKLSETNFALGNKLVLIAQETSELKMEKILSLKRTLMFLSFMVLIIYMYALYKYIHLNRNNMNLSKIAYIDPLTKLPNRVRCDQVVKEYSKMDRLPNLACIFIDLNNLKATNDTYGHDMGDNLIREFGYILRDISVNYGFICRNGGDEFIGLFENIPKKMMDKYIMTLEKKVSDFNDESANIKISFAYGIAYSDEKDIVSINDLMALADRRMYLDKKRVKK